MRTLYIAFASNLTIALLLSAAPARAQHAGDFWPGVSAAGQLKLSPMGYNPENPILLPPAGGLFQGWSSNNPGFNGLVASDPHDDMYTFEPGGQIWLQVIALDPALYVWDAGFHTYAPGSMALLGPTTPELHTHLIWHIRSNAPLYDPLKTLWRGTFQLIDSGATQYAASAPFVLYFRNVACLAGDVNGDGQFNNFDIDPFVAVLLDTSGATAEQRCAADANLDGYVNNFDIDAFVMLLIGG